MKLIVGLGNPDLKYNLTRHNLGFIVLDSYLKEVKWNTKFSGLCYNKIINGEKVIFMKPQTYMNLSGKALKEVVSFYKIDYNDILIIQDDLDMQLGKYKVKKDSRSGGHNGIQSIIDLLGTKKIARLKIGINNDCKIDAADYVLEKFKSDELELINSKLPEYVKIIDNFIEGGYDLAKKDV